MSILTEISSPIKEIGKVLDSLFTSDDERLSKQVVMEKLENAISLGQLEINKIEATHKSIFVAGWRPSIGWVCTLGIFYEFLLRPIMNGFGYSFPGVESNALFTLTSIILGAAGMRTFEKVKKVI